MTSEDVLLGVDVGGTTTAAGLVSDDGAVLAETSAPTHRDGPGTAVATITALVQTLLDRARRDGWPVAGVGLGVPGIVDAPGGPIGDEVPNVPELAGVALAATLGRRFGVAVFADNDVNALALGEHRFGAGRDARSLVVLAPGTGFGAGLVLDGRLVRGAAGFAGEFGHAPVKFDGRPCWCGGRGCVAVYASGRGIAEAAREQAALHRDSALWAAAGEDPTAITAPRVFEAAEAGDRVAAGIVADACRALGALIAMIVNGLNPEVVVVTGGVTAAYAAREKQVLAAAAEHAFARALAGTRVRLVPGDKRVTMRGAAALVRYELDRR